MPRICFDRFSPYMILLTCMQLPNGNVWPLKLAPVKKSTKKRIANVLKTKKIVYVIFAYNNQIRYIFCRVNTITCVYAQ